MISFLLVMAALSNERISTSIGKPWSVSGKAWWNSYHDATGSWDWGGVLSLEGYDPAEGHVTIYQCHFSGCSCTTNGGAISIYRVTALIHGCQLDGCQTSGTKYRNTGNGGGIYSDDCVLSVNTTIFMDCSASANGGSIFASGRQVGMRDSSLNLSFCTFKPMAREGSFGAQKDGLFVYVYNPSSAKLRMSVDITDTTCDGPQNKWYYAQAAYFHCYCDSILISGLTSTKAVAFSRAPMMVLLGRTEVLVEDCVFSDKTPEQENLPYGFIETGACDREAFVTYRNCQFTPLRSENTGAIKSNKCNLTITACNFTEITAVKDGIIHVLDHYTTDIMVVIEDCIIKQCSTQAGSALMITQSFAECARISILGTTFDGNACADGSVRWRLSDGQTYGTGSNFVIEKCTFKNHKPSVDCLITINPVAHFPSPVTLKKIVFVDNELACTNGVISIATSSLTYDECLFETMSISVPKNQQIRKGVVVLAGDAGAKFSLSSCQFVDCEVIGSGSIIMSPVNQAKSLATEIAELILIENCDVSGCKANESHQLSFICNQLLIMGGTFECNDTQQFSFIGIWITGAPEKELESYVSATFIMDGPSSAFQHSMIELHSDAGHDTYFDSLSVTSSELESNMSVPLADSPPYILLENDGDVFFFNATFDVSNEKAIHQAEGRTGKVVFLNERPSKPAVPSFDSPIIGTYESLTDSQDSSPDSNADLIGGIIGGILAAVAIAGIVVLVLFILRRRQSKTFDSTGGSCDNTQETNTGTQNTESGDPVDDPLGEWEKPVDFPENFNEDENDA